MSRGSGKHCAMLAVIVYYKGKKKNVLVNRALSRRSLATKASVLVDLDALPSWHITMLTWKVCTSPVS